MRRTMSEEAGKIRVMLDVGVELHTFGWCANILTIKQSLFSAFDVNQSLFSIRGYVFGYSTSEWFIAIGSGPMSSSNEFHECVTKHGFGQCISK